MPDAGRVATTLAGIRAIEQAATPGPWKHRTAEHLGDWTTSSKVFRTERVEADARPAGIGIFDAPADAEFTVSSRNALPLLLAALEAALKAADDWDAEAETLAAAADRDRGPLRMTRAMLGARVQVLRECAQALREAITAELTKEAGDG